MSEFPLTIEMLREKFQGSVDVVVEYGKSFEKSYPENQFKKPFLNSRHSSEEALEYSTALKKYEIAQASYAQERRTVREWNNKVTTIIEDFVKEVSGLNTLKSEKQREKLWAYVYNNDHDSGLAAVYYEICELIEIIQS